MILRNIMSKHFTEIPIKICASFYKKPTYIDINRDGKYNYKLCDKYPGTDLKIFEKSRRSL